jgi:hypothetical protein
MSADQRNVHRKLAVAFDEFLGSVERIYQPVVLPLASLIEADLPRFLRQYRQAFRQGLEFTDDQRVGCLICSRERGPVVFKLDREIAGVDVHDSLPGGRGDAANPSKQLQIDGNSHWDTRRMRV